MRYSKKMLSIVSVLLIIAAVAAFSIISPAAVTKFVSGDFEFAVLSEDIIEVSAYLGDGTDIDLPETVEGKIVSGIYPDCFRNSDITSVAVPDIYKYIGNFAFYECKELKTINMPASLEKVGAMAFYGCENLESVDFSKVNAFTSLSFAMFSGCKSLAEINLPESVTSLNENVFVNCESLTKVTMSDKITTIPEYAFYGCKSLNSIDLPSELVKIDAYAFAEDASLSLIDLPFTLTVIGENAFENDTALSELFIPDTVTKIGANAFMPMSYNGKIEVTCYEDSYAEDYCYNNNVTNLITIKKKIGDANLDGEADILDVTLIQKYKIGTAVLGNNRAKDLADVNRDGKITVRDATLIQMYIAKMIEL